MSVVDKWGGTIQGASGVFNDRLTERDVDFIKGRLARVAEPSAEVIATLRAAEEPKIQNLFRLIGSDVLESLKRILPSLGLVRYNGADFPAEYDLGYGGNVVLCRKVENGDLVIVDFNRGEAPTDTLLRLLHYMSWVRQNLAGSKEVSGMILTESANESLKAICERGSECISPLLSNRDRTLGRTHSPFRLKRNRSTTGSSAASLPSRKTSMRGDYRW